MILIVLSVVHRVQLAFGHCRKNTHPSEMASCCSLSFRSNALTFFLAPGDISKLANDVVIEILVHLFLVLVRLF